MGEKLVRFTLTEAEYEAALDKAIDNGFATIPEYVRFLLFGETNNTVDYEALLLKFKQQVSLKARVKRFKVRDMFDPIEWESIPDQARRNLGRMIQRKIVKQPHWLPIVPDGKDSANAQWYRRHDKENQ